MTQNLALFDFDGTITSTDTFIKFIQFAKGSAKLFIGFALLSPYLILMKLKVYPNWTLREEIVPKQIKYSMKNIQVERNVSLVKLQLLQI